MASRILHLAVAKKITDQLPVKDENRFRLGVLLPDAYCADVPKSDSHLKIIVCGGSKKTYDLQKFQNLFADKMKTDDLYLGYYLHLIQDMVFRRLVYEEYRWDPRIPGNVERLWNDYKLINPYVVASNDLKNEITFPTDFSGEEINKLYSFDIKTLACDLAADFEEAEKSQNDTVFFFTKEMASAFIDRAAEVCISEVTALREGRTGIKPCDYAWWDLRPSLLKTTQNTRDLGGYPTTDGRMTKWNSLIRSDVQRYPSQDDFDFLKSNGITTVIDMRSEQDIAKKPNGFAGSDGIHYLHCPIAEGDRVPEFEEGVPISYLDIACSDGIAQVFRSIAAAENGIIFNCSAGKDRTGVVSAILLCHAGVKDEDIIDNYVLTKEYGKERTKLVHQKFPEININVLIPKEDFMREFLRLFREQYNNTENYFKEIGLNEAEIARIKEKSVNQ